MAATPDYILYVVRGQGASNNAESLLGAGDKARIEVEDLSTIRMRPGWLEGVPTLVNFRPQSDGVWRGPVWEGIHAIRKLRELCPKGAERLVGSLATSGNEVVHEIDVGDGGQTFMGTEATLPEGEEGMTIAEGLFSVDENASCTLPIDGADNIEELNSYVQQCIERRKADMPEELDD
jgi:hypothetical protein